MEHTYAFVVEGDAAQDPGQVWRVEGELRGSTPTLAEAVLVHAFRELTGGRATYRNLQTCRGPYTITRLEIRRVGA